MTAPPSDWRPRHVVEPAPPRNLPAQDHHAMDADEARARLLTRGVAIAAGTILVVLLCAVCSRALFGL